jgi:hypothetical protein
MSAMVNLSCFIRFHALRTPDHLAIVYKDRRIMVLPSEPPRVTAA